MSQFLIHVIDDLVGSVQHWRQVYSTYPPAEVVSESCQGGVG